jgi:hypothetical protein
MIDEGGNIKGNNGLHNDDGVPVVKLVRVILAVAHTMLYMITIGRGGEKNNGDSSNDYAGNADRCVDCDSCVRV